MNSQLLKEISKIIRNELRTADFPARYGGEEFSLILPETPSESAMLVAERIRKKEKGALLTFLSSDNIGVVVTVKPGQLGVQVALKDIFSLRQKFPNKKFYFLVCDTIDFPGL